MTAEDPVFLSGRRGESDELDHSARNWKTVWQQGPIFLGSDGNSLVFEMHGSAGSAPITLDWLDAPSELVQPWNHVLSLEGDILWRE